MNLKFPPVEVLNYFLPVCDAFGKSKVYRSTFLTQECWSSQFENDRELQRTVWLHFDVSEQELQQQFTWLDSELKGEYEVQPGIFFGNAHDESDGVYLRTKHATIRGQVSSGKLYTKIWFETPPQLFTDKLWNSHRDWFEENAL